MKTLDEVQEHARSLIAADAYFAGLTVLAEIGASGDLREKALREKGVCVSVLPLDEGRTISNGSGIVSVGVSVLVLTEFDSIVNAGAGGAAKNIYVALRKIKHAILFYGSAANDPKNPNDRYLAGERAFDFSDHDPGLLAYIQTFRKTCVF